MTILRPKESANLTPFPSVVFWGNSAAMNTFPWDEKNGYCANDGASDRYAERWNTSDDKRCERETKYEKEVFEGANGLHSSCPLPQCYIARQGSLDW